MMSLEKPAERPQDYQGKYWKVEVEFLYLIVFADWKFTNLNFLFENMIGWNIPHKHGIERTLRFESNVAASTIVGIKSHMSCEKYNIYPRRNITNPHISNIFQCVNNFET